MNRSKWWPWLPCLLVLLWLIYLCFAIWQRALHSVQPPIYDPLSYLQKAKNFWEAVEQAKFFNPLNLDPTARPPGSVLMSHPFGFSPGFHGFHFRSVFLPILIMVVTVYTVAGAFRTKVDRWWVAAIALLCSSLPMFYQLDWVAGFSSQSRWGSIDNFHSSIAALAMAATVRSLVLKSQFWFISGISLASFTLLVKPSGMMVMALIGLIWMMVVLSEWLWDRKHRSQNSILRSYFIKSASFIVIVYPCVIALCLSSSYLSSSNFSYAQKALKVMREMLQISFQKTIMWFHPSTGEALPLWIIGVGVLFVFSLLAARGRIKFTRVRILVLMAGSLLIWGLGVWYWRVVQAGGNQIRYFYPFMLMGVVCMIPAALYTWPQVKKPFRMILMAICFMPALNIAGLLAAGDNPPLLWQKISGVSLSVGTDREEVQQAYSFLGEIRKMNKSVKLYSFSRGVPPSVFENVGMYEEILRPDLPVFRNTIPKDWVRGFVVRINELISSDYILIRKFKNQEARDPLRPRHIPQFHSEQAVFESWLSTVNEGAGLEITSDGRELRLLRVADQIAFERAVDRFVSVHTWRPAFLEANKPRWWNADSVSAQEKNLAANDIGFEGIYTVHTLAINRINSGFKIEIWWEELRYEEANKQRYLFVHLMDSSNNILYNQQFVLSPYQPISENRKWHYSEVTFNVDGSTKDLASLAFGIYQPNVGRLRIDNPRTETDWKNRSISISLPAPSTHH